MICELTLTYLNMIMITDNIYRGNKTNIESDSNVYHLSTENCVTNGLIYSHFLLSYELGLCPVRYKANS